jgi:quaternary ammonium compound-resistance protein SugE
MTAWIYLSLAAAFEVMFAMSMKYSEGFTRFWPSVATAVGVVGGIGFLTLAMKTMPVSVAYPIWTAVGTLGTVTLGWLLLGESLTPLKALSALAIVAGVAGLKVASA